MCTMLHYLLFCGIVLLVLHNHGSSGLKLVEVSSVKVENGNCVYGSVSFPTYFQTNGSLCEDWTCEPKKHTLTIVGCSPPRPGCRRNTSVDLRFPVCCEEICLEATQPYCVAPDNTPIMEGLEYNSTDPCGRYMCQNKTLIQVAGCPELEAKDDPSCQPSFAERAPFPACCPAAVVCTSSGKRRRR
uniref:Single domain-containing protein n=1 Tax=Amblyomma maculatum TaxID=34609 RepID=G3MRN5_AMBMU